LRRTCPTLARHPIAEPGELAMAGSSMTRFVYGFEASGVARAIMLLT
jgi:hypothetical protein